jgi:hypothetical protein
VRALDGGSFVSSLFYRIFVSHRQQVRFFLTLEATTIHHNYSVRIGLRALRSPASPENFLSIAYVVKVLYDETTRALYFLLTNAKLPELKGAWLK